MARNSQNPRLNIGGVSPKLDAVMVEEAPVLAGRDALVAIEVQFPLPRLSRCPNEGDAAELVIADETIQGVVASVEVIGSEIGETAVLTIATEIERARGEWSVAVRDRKRSQLLAACIATTLAGSQKAAVDEAVGRFELRSSERWHAGAQQALLCGQLLLASSAGYVLARPDQPVGVRKLERASYRYRQRGMPTLTLVAIGEDGSGARQQLSGRPYLAPVTRAFDHQATVAELRAAATAIAAIQTRDVDIEGGPELLDLAPGSWVEVGREAPRLITRRTRSWSRGAGWRVVLAGGYDWSGGLRRPDTAEIEPCSVVGYDEELGALRVRYERHELEGLVGLRADRAAAGDQHVVMPNVGDRGVAAIGGVAERGLYLGAPMPPGAVSGDEFRNFIELQKAENSKHALGKNGALEQQYTEVNRETRGRETYRGDQFAYEYR